MIETKKRTEHSLTMDEWKTYLDPEGRVTNVEKLKLKIYNAVSAEAIISKKATMTKLFLF